LLLPGAGGVGWHAWLLGGTHLIIIVGTVDFQTFGWVACL
jgi:hypothetical protein